jgi:hypothetical protein
VSNGSKARHTRLKLPLTVEYPPYAVGGTLRRNIVKFLDRVQLLWFRFVGFGSL